jgi:hypothetical protein
MRSLTFAIRMLFRTPFVTAIAIVSLALGNNKVGSGYFSALGIPRIAGREFTDADTVNSAKVALVNQTFAKKFGLGNDAVGKLMGWAPGEGYRSKKGRSRFSFR